MSTDRIEIASLPNLRDIGGYAAADGRRVRTGQLFRSTELSKLAGADLAKFAGLGVRTVYDLRTSAERAAEPDVVSAGTEVVVCDVLADSQDAAPASLLQVLEDPEAAKALLGGSRATEMFEKGYREIVSLPSALASYRSFFDGIADAHRRPALFHCTTGKDRTGWAAAATLMLLGVDEVDIRHDYELTNRDLLPALRPVLDRFRDAGGDPDLLKPILGVAPSYLDASLAEMEDRFGSIEGYFEKGLGIGPEVQAALRTDLTEPIP